MLFELQFIVLKNQNLRKYPKIEKTVVYLYNKYYITKILA